MPIIAYVGDTHGEIDRMYKCLQALEQNRDVKIDAVVQVGDFGIYLPSEGNSEFVKYWKGEKIAPYPTYVCPGNHEEWAVLEWWMKQPYKMTNMFLMPNGKVIDICGVSHGAVWGNFSWKSWQNPKRVYQARKDNPRSLKSTHITPDVCESLVNEGLFDVFVSHEAAARHSPKFEQPGEIMKALLGLEKDERAAGCPGFLDIYEKCMPQYHYFGHFHTYAIMRLAEPRVICLHALNYDSSKAIELRSFE